MADSVRYDRRTQILTAAGSVEVRYSGSMLRAQRIEYDAQNDTIQATGPITLTDATGNVLLAEEATLAPDLREGLIEGARLLIEGNLQIAAAQVRRTSGRYTSLYRTVASSCTICSGSPTPTWALRAARVTQDAVARRIYFENATFELFGLPIGYLPRLSIPDPAARRASGVLVPSVSRSDIYGYGLKVPYYRVLGSHADATITPFVTSIGSFLIEGEYRQRVASGGFELSGVIVGDDALDDRPEVGHPRGAFRALGAFALGAGYDAAFDLNATSDEDFLEQFAYSAEDRLTSTAGITRTRAFDHISLGTIAFQSLRTGESTGDIPFILPEFSYRRVLAPPVAGGLLALDLQTLGVHRHRGRDVLRWGGGIDWRRDWLLRGGVLAAALARTQLDAYRVRDDPDLPAGVQGRVVPEAGVELRWPLVRRTASAQHVVEPIAQVFVSKTLGDDEIPNEDSQLPELDRSNLFSRDRFAGRDRVETGLRGNLGLSYTRRHLTGWTLQTTLGRVIRRSPVDDFAEGTGLAGRWSDYVGTLSLDLPPSIRLVERALFDAERGFRRSELAFSYETARGSARATYIFLAEDEGNPILGAQPETSELQLEGLYRVHRNWAVRGNWRYDATSSSNLRAGAGITYANDCAEFDLSASRRYTSSSNVPPATTIGFSVSLAGLGGRSSADWPSRGCARLTR